MAAASSLQKILTAWTLTALVVEEASSAESVAGLVTYVLADSAGSVAVKANVQEAWVGVAVAVIVVELEMATSPQQPASYQPQAAGFQEAISPEAHSALVELTVVTRSTCGMVEKRAKS